MPRRRRLGPDLTRILALVALGMAIVSMTGLAGPWLPLAVMVLALALLI